MAFQKGFIVYSSHGVGKFQFVKTGVAFQTVEKPVSVDLQCRICSLISNQNQDQHQEKLSHHLYTISGHLMRYRIDPHKAAH